MTFLLKADHEYGQLRKIDEKLVYLGNGGATSETKFKKMLNAAERLSKRTGEAFETVLEMYKISEVRSYSFK